MGQFSVTIYGANGSVLSHNQHHSGLKAFEPGYIHIDVKYPPHIANETLRGYLFVAINWATQWVFITMYRNKTAANAWHCLGDLKRACQIRIKTI